MEDNIKKLKRIKYLNNLMNDVKKEITSEQELNINKGNKLLKLNFFIGIFIGLIAYFFLDVTYKYLLLLCIIAIILVIFIYFRVRYVVNKLEQFKLIVLSDIQKQINELKESD